MKNIEKDVNNLMEGFRLTTTTNTKISVTAPRGFEGGVEKEDLIIPRAKLLQAMSPEMQEGGFTVGEIINSLTKEYLAEEFIPIFMFKNSSARYSLVSE